MESRRRSDFSQYMGLHGVRYHTQPDCLSGGKKVRERALVFKLLDFYGNIIGNLVTAGIWFFAHLSPGDCWSFSFVSPWIRLF